MPEIGTSGSMSGMWKRSMVRIVRHRQTKGPATDRPNLTHRATSRLHHLDSTELILARGTLSVSNIPAVPFYLSVAASFRENGCNSNLDPHLWIAEGGDSQSSPDGGVVGHVVTEPLGHRLVHLVRKTNVIGVHLDHMLPRRTGASQGPFDIAECLGDLIRERLRELPVIVPAALP